MHKIVRKHAWRGGKLVKQEHAIHEKGYSMCITQCSACRTTLYLRWHDETGYICEDCFVKAVDCSVPGCHRIATTDGLCRAHYMGTDRHAELGKGYSMIAHEGSW